MNGFDSILMRVRLAAAFLGVRAGIPDVRRRVAECVQAANPYGCNQYGCGWKMPHNGKSTRYVEDELGKRRKEVTHDAGVEPKGGDDGGRRGDLKTGKAKTKEEALADTRSLLPEKNRKNGSVHFDNSVSVEMINDLNAALEEISAKYPSDYLFEIGSRKNKDNKVTAWVNAHGLFINHDDAKEGIFSIRNDRPYSAARKAKTGFSRWAVGDTENGSTMRAVIFHEYGHVVSQPCMQAKKLYDFTKNNRGAGKFDEGRRAALNAWNAWEREYKRNKGFFRANVGEYSQDNAMEGFAEAFAYREVEGGKLPDGLNAALDKVIKLGTIRAK